MIEEESSEEEAEPDFIEGVCDYHHCHGKTFMRCDYDLNDIIDNKKSTRCQLVLTCRWRGIRGCERQFCMHHAGKAQYWPSRCVNLRRSGLVIIPCEDCYYWVRYVKCKFWGLIFLCFVWAALVALIIWYSHAVIKGTYGWEHRLNDL